MVLVQTHPALADDGPLALLRQRRAEADAALPKSLAWSSFLFLTAAVSILFAMTALNGGSLRIETHNPTADPPRPENRIKDIFGTDPYVAVPIVPPTNPGEIVPVKDAAVPVDDTPPIVEPTPGTQQGILPGTGESSPVPGGGGGGGTEPLPVRGVFTYYESAPEAIVKIVPEYPPLAREAGMEGTVRLDILVGRDGRVVDAVVTHSAAMFDDAALTAARQWRFRPALSSGHPVAVWITLPVRFTLH